MSETTAKKIRPEKLEAVKEIKTRFEKAKIAILTDYQGEEGLPVKELQSLRRKLRQGKGEIKVVKNTLAKKALHELKIEGIASHLERSSAIVFGYEDPAATAKILFDFAKDHKSAKSEQGLPVIKAALLEEGKILDNNQVRFLAALPPRPILLGQLLGTMNAPVTGLVTVLSGVMRGLVTALDQVRKQKEQM